VQSRWNSFEEEASLHVRDFLSYERVMDVNPFEVTSQHRVAQPLFERRMRRALKVLQIGAFMPRTLISLSNGERQRVQLARALAQPLRLLILDEPYVGLDRAMRAHFHQLLERLLETSLRILLITTRVDELPRHITHLLHVDECRVIAQGLRSEVLSLANTVAAGKQRPRSQTSTRPESPRRASQQKRTRAKLINLRQATVRYGSAVILQNIDWTVREGESWALLGPNGSGKTTLLSLVLGDNPQAYVNEVVVFGKRRGTGESVWHLKRRIGWVSPELHLHFDETATVFEVVVSGFYETNGLFQNPTQRQASEAKSLMKRFELLDAADLPLFSLSVGMQRMALLARALVKAPRLLILDEPCQGLDPEHRDLILQNVDALIRGGAVTAIFVTHRPEEIPRSIKHVLRLGAPGLHVKTTREGI
jgi:molybdate transport system ATP-binding protein